MQPKAPWTTTASAAAKIAKRAQDSSQRKLERRRERIRAQLHNKRTNKPDKPKFRRIAPVSKRKTATRAQYVREAREYVRECRRAGLKCPVVNAIPELRNGLKYGRPISDKIREVHHKAGRLGALLLFKLMWMGISKEGHRWVHANIEEARRRGWIASVGLWNNPTKVLKIAQAVTTDGPTFERMMQLYEGAR